MEVGIELRSERMVMPGFSANTPGEARYVRFSVVAEVRAGVA